jgi:hypothetical protein
MVNSMRRGFVHQPGAHSSASTSSTTVASPDLALTTAPKQKNSLDSFYGVRMRLKGPRVFEKGMTPHHIAFGQSKCENYKRPLYYVAVRRPWNEKDSKSRLHLGSDGHEHLCAFESRYSQYSLRSMP